MTYLGPDDSCSLFLYAAAGNCDAEDLQEEAKEQQGHALQRLTGLTFVAGCSTNHPTSRCLKLAISACMLQHHEWLLLAWVD